MSISRTLMMAAMAVCLSINAASAAAEKADNVRAIDAPAAAQEITFAILDFAAKDTGKPELGAQIAEVLGGVLSGEAGFRLVDRTTLQKLLDEQALGLTGLVSTEQAVQVGKLVGARLILAGRAFTLGDHLMLTVKIIGTETSLVETVLVKHKLDADLGDVVLELAAKVSERLASDGARLVAQSSEADPLPALKESLANRALPRVAVIVREEHRGAPPILDPAVETELKRMLLACGFSVQDIPQNDLADFARTWSSQQPESWPRSLASADFVIVGEGFSELLTRVGTLTSCAARAEINVIRRSDGSIVHADRTTTRAVDLAENVAGKTALQRAGRDIGLDLLRYFDRTLPEAAGAE